MTLDRGNDSPASSRWWTTLDIATLAFVARLAVVVYALCEPVWDGHYYDLGARHIAWSHGYGEELHLSGPGGLERVVWDPWAHYPVGYSGFLAIFFKIFGGSLAVAPLANALSGAALAAVAHRLALYMFPTETSMLPLVTFKFSTVTSKSPSVTSKSPLVTSRWPVRADLAGVLVALHPGLVLYSGALMTEPLAALGMMAAILFVVADRSALRGCAVAGVLMGLTTLVRPNAILLAPFLPFLRIDERTWRERIPRLFFRGIVVGALAVAAVAPWTVRNCEVMDRCAVVSTNAGWNLVIGSAPGATGKFEFLVGHTPEGGPTCDEGGQVAQDRCWWRYGLQLIRRDLRRWLALIPAKLHYTLDAEWFPINYLREARPDVVSARAHVVVGKILTALQDALCIVAALAVFGRPRGRRDRLIPYAVQLGFLAATIALAAWGMDRVDPTVWPLAVVACVLPFVPLPGSPKRAPVEYAVAAIVLTTLLTHAVFFGEDRYHLVATPALILLACGLGRPMRSQLSSA